MTTHFTARVRLTKASARRSHGAKPLITSADAIVEAAEIYRIYFHGPAYQVSGARLVGWKADDRADGRETCPAITNRPISRP